MTKPNNKSSLSINLITFITRKLRNDKTQKLTLATYPPLHLSWRNQCSRTLTMKPLTSILFFSFCIIAAFSEPTPIVTASEHPQPNQIQIQNAVGASTRAYTVTIKTSCKSPSYTRDRISLSFGDAHGYQVYVPRLDDPSSRTFERCSTDTFHVNGPCTYQLCYLYLYRTGYDGWEPESATVSTFNYPPATSSQTTPPCSSTSAFDCHASTHPIQLPSSLHFR